MFWREREKKGKVNKCWQQQPKKGHSGQGAHLRKSDIERNLSQFSIPVSGMSLQGIHWSKTKVPASFSGLHSFQICFLSPYCTFFLFAWRTRAACNEPCFSSARSPRDPIDLISVKLALIAIWYFGHY